MAYDPALALRVETILKGRRGVTRKPMFGGLCFLVNGKMFCGVERNRMVVRVGKERYEDCLKKPHVRPMDFTGRPIRGFIYVESSGLKATAQLKRWVNAGFDFASSLPKK